jgi:hypothetical protein
MTRPQQSKWQNGCNLCVLPAFQRRPGQGIWFDCFRQNKVGWRAVLRQTDADLTGIVRCQIPSRNHAAPLLPFDFDQRPACCLHGTLKKNPGAPNNTTTATVAGSANLGRQKFILSCAACSEMF